MSGGCMLRRCRLTSWCDVELVALACSLNRLSLLRLGRRLLSFLTAAADGACAACGEA